MALQKSHWLGCTKWWRLRQHERQPSDTKLVLRNLSWVDWVLQTAGCSWLLASQLHIRRLGKLFESAQALPVGARATRKDEVARHHHRPCPEPQRRCYLFSHQYLCLEWKPVHQTIHQSHPEGGFHANIVYDQNMDGGWRNKWSLPRVFRWDRSKCWRWQTLDREVQIELRHDTSFPYQQLGKQDSSDGQSCELHQAMLWWTRLDSRRVSLGTVPGRTARSRHK